MNPLRSVDGGIVSPVRSSGIDPAGSEHLTARDLAKLAVFWLATILVAPMIISYHIRAAFIGRNRALEGSTQALALVPGIWGQYLRRAFLARALASCHWTVTVEFGTIFSDASSRLDAFVYIGPRCHLGLVHVERDVLIAAAVHIPSGPDTHGIADLSKPIREQPGRLRMVHIGAGTWIGSAAIVMADVGRDSVVAAGSVVIRPIPDRVLAAGVPARVLRSREAPDTRSA
jgi:virginiamycin A acetyltransferase